MKSVQFAIPYRADSGAALQVVYRLDSDDNGKVNVLPMNEVGCGEWRAALEFDDVDDVVMRFSRRSLFSACCPIGL